MSESRIERMTHHGLDGLHGLRGLIEEIPSVKSYNPRESAIQTMMDDYEKILACPPSLWRDELNEALAA